MQFYCLVLFIGLNSSAFEMSYIDFCHLLQVEHIFFFFTGPYLTSSLKPYIQDESDSGILPSFPCGIRYPGLWNPEFSSRNPESRQRLKSGIQVPLTRIQNIQKLESRIQDCLGLPNMGPSLNCLLMRDDSFSGVAREQRVKFKEAKFI